jgi:hypothetical protein
VLRIRLKVDVSGPEHWYPGSESATVIAIIVLCLGGNGRHSWQRPQLPATSTSIHSTISSSKQSKAKTFLPVPYCIYVVLPLAFFISDYSSLLESKSRTIVIESGLVFSFPNCLHCFTLQEFTPI